MFHVFSALIAFYVIWRLVCPLPWSKVGRGLSAVVVLLISQHHLINRNFFGTMASPEVPFLVLAVLGWAFGSLIFVAALFLIKDLVALLLFPFQRTISRALLTTPGLRYGTAALGMIAAAIGVAEAVRVPSVKTVEIEVRGLPQSFDGFRLVQLTDLHASRLLEAPWMQAVVDKTNALNPDMIVITGDLIDGTVQARAADILPLRSLRADHGVYAIPGNHEYYADYVSWMDAFERLGLPMLRNAHVRIASDDADIVLAGITDRVADTFSQASPDVLAALEGVADTDSVILLSHRPPGAALNAALGVDLQLSGHTHGGQIWGGHLLTKWANEGYVSGLYEVNGMQLYVSHGAGLWNGFPLRLGQRSEITEIILRPVIPKP